MSEISLTEEQKQHILYNHITYALYVVLAFTTGGLLWILPIFMNYFFRPGVKGTWLESHYSWQISTFWGSIVLVIIGWAIIFIGGGASIAGILAGEFSIAIGASLLFLVIGGLILLVGYLWNLYRIARGWIALANKTSVP